MKALVYTAPNQVQLQDRPRPSLVAPTDAIIRITRTTICGTDLHIRKGDVPTCQPGHGRVLGHEGIGVVEEVGASVRAHKPGDRVVVSAISACATCAYCRRGMASHCEGGQGQGDGGGWVLGNTVDGTQAEFVRVPHADGSLFAIPPAQFGQDAAAAAALVMLSDALPTGYECGVLNGKVQPGGTVAVVGVGPVGLACIITAQLFSPATIIAIDNDPNRLRVAREAGAAVTLTAAEAFEGVRAATPGGRGCDTVVEAVGIPATFEMCQGLLAPGGTLANIGVHGTKVDLHLEELWDRNITITTRLVDTVSTPLLLRLVESGRLDASKLVTHHFRFDEIEKAYEVFGAAAEHDCMKVIIDME